MDTTNQALALTAPAPASATAGGAPGRARSFSFGEPEGALDRREFLSYAESRWSGRWYEPPMPLGPLARTRFMSPHHASAIAFKVNQLCRFFEPSRWLSLRDFREFATNFLLLGNGYFQRVDNLAGRPMQLANTPAIYVRCARDDRFWWVESWGAAREFDPGTVYQLRETDLTQEIYGLPEWLPALNAGLLNEAATVFRRRYYKNGSHAGYILTVTDAGFSNEDADALEEAIAQSKGPGNFKNLFLHIPNGKEKGVQVIPIGEAAAKDEFANMKNVTRDDVLAAHRVPALLIGVVPVGVVGGFGKPAEAADVYHTTEVEPLQLKMLEVNDWLGLPAVAFRPYVPQAGAQPTS